MVSTINSIVEKLKDPALFDHPVSGFQVLETHSSVVLLTGPIAYKFKRAVHFGFLDYHTLELRHEACLRELAINRRYAPELYMAVVPVYGTAECPAFEPSGDVLEYAIKMRQFDQAQLLAVQAETGKLSPAVADAIATQMAGLHNHAAKAAMDSDVGSAACVRRWMLENFTAMTEVVTDKVMRTRLDAMRAWTELRLVQAAPLLEQRKRDGFVRDCHGDLHLGNMILQEDKVFFFDAIEFNEELRWIDVQSELAFVLMDLEDRGLPRLANTLLNRYLSLTGDYAGVALLPMFWVYRAMVRAKVGLLQAAGAGSALRHLDHLLTLCSVYVHPQGPGMIILHGLSGSGKSWLATRVAAALRAIQLRSDVERKRMHGAASGAQPQALPGEGLYAPAAGERTYARLLALSESLLDSGFAVVVDAAFLKAAQRAPFSALAKSKDIPMVLLVLELPATELRRRIAMRRQRNESLSPENRDPSDADERVLEFQMRIREVPGATEAPMVLDEHWPLDANVWLERIGKALNRTIVPE
jgi:hypothetical protein